MPLPLHAYQEQRRFAWLAQRKRAGLFDRPRVGKTAQVIRAMDLLGHNRGIIVVPAVARENWRFASSAASRCNSPRCARVSPSTISWHGANGHFDVLVTSYEMMVRWSPYIHERCEPLAFMHFDEGHMLKNADTNRTKTLLGPGAEGIMGALQWAEYSWWLTGTPVPNDPLDIWTWLRHQRVMPSVAMPSRAATSTAGPRCTERRSRRRAT